MAHYSLTAGELSKLLPVTGLGIIVMALAIAQKLNEGKMKRTLEKCPSYW